MHGVVGAVLVAGLVVFTIGAAAWRLEYERPLAESLPLIHADRRRRTWIHSWMIAALFVTPAGLMAYAVLPETRAGVVAAVLAGAVYLLGAGCFLVSLMFRMAVVPWAAERSVADGDPPPGFAAFNTWAGYLYVVHMAASYAAFALLGWSVLAAGLLPHWAGWTGVGWGAGFLAGFAATRFAGPFNPPFWAHAYPALLGVLLLVG